MPRCLLRQLLPLSSPTSLLPEKKKKKKLLLKALFSLAAVSPIVARTIRTAQDEAAFNAQYYSAGFLVQMGATRATLPSLPLAADFISSAIKLFACFDWKKSFELGQSSTPTKLGTWKLRVVPRAVLV